MNWIRNRSFYVVIRWQILITLIIALLCGWFLGIHGAVSGILGGMVSVISSTAYAMMVSGHKGYTAESAVRTALRAEAIKIIVIIFSLWAVFAAYAEVVPVAFIGVFIMTVIVFSLALFVPDSTKDNIK